MASESTTAEFSKQWINSVRRLKSTELQLERRKEQSKSESESERRRRLVELVVLPSTSPANAAMNSAEKEKIWHVACYGCEQDRPMPTYTCVSCEKKGEHWLVDCPNEGYRRWCQERAEMYKSASVDPDTNGDRWYFCSNPKVV